MSRTPEAFESLYTRESGWLRTPVRNPNREGEALNVEFHIEADAFGIVQQVRGPIDEILGISAAQLTARPLVDLVNPTDLDRLEGALRDDQPPGSIVAVRFLDHAGRSVWVALETSTELVPTDAPTNRVITAKPYAPIVPPEADDSDDPNRHHALVQNSADMMVIVEPDGTVRFTNLAMLRLLGLEPDGLLGTQVLDIIHPADHDLLTGVVATTLEHPERTPGFEFRARHVDGSYRWIEGRLQNLLDQPQVGGLLGIGRDVTDRHHAQEMLSSSEERFRSLTSSSPSAIFELDPAGRLQFANDRWFDVTGSRFDEVDDVFAVIHRDDVESIRRRWATGSVPNAVDERVRVERPDGELRWVELRTRPVHDADGQVTAVVGTLHDVTDIETANRKLEHLATHDSLTGLPNRSLLLDRLQLAVASAFGSVESIALLFVDLDRFKVINDSLGHHAGDRVLVVVAERLSDLVRPQDVVARFGGDEFVVLCAPITSKEQAIALAERIRVNVSGGVDVDGDVVHVSVSVGVVFGSGETKPENLLRDADAAMYAAKASGRDRARVFDEEMHQAAMERLTIETGLRQSVEDRNFELHYQPLVDLATSQTSAVEALLRWRHPTRGLVPPEEFLDVAEESGILGPLGSWVLEQACAHAAGWPAVDGVHAPSLFVNLAAVQLADPRIVDLVARVLDQSGLMPARLVLEVTERMLMASPDATALVLHALRELGVRIAIDDFGTGYSSLSYLTRLPVDLLKIDCSFVAGLAENAADREVTAAIIAMAHALGLQAVAEGVESEEQLDVLRELACDTVQGFWFSRPVMADEVPGVLASLHERLSRARMIRAATDAR